MDKLHRLFFGHRRVNLCSFKAMKVPTKILHVLFAVLLATLFASCSNSNEEPVVHSKSNEFPVAAKDYFVLNPFHIALPKGFSVEKIPHFELGIFQIKDSVGNDFMDLVRLTYYHGGFPIKFSEPKNPYEFSEAGRRDTVWVDNGVEIRVRSVYIWSSRIHSKGNHEAPYEILEFNYHPDQVDSSICENIIRSAKIHSYNKNYLCSIYTPDNDSLGGVTMSKLRNLHMKDIQTLVKDIELLPVVSADQDFFEKNGKYLFLADCFMDDEYKGSFHINESCEIGWNGKYAEKTDVVDLLMSMEDKPFKERLLKKCQVEPPPRPPHNCSKLYKLNIHYSKNDVPQSFDFTYHSRSKYLEDEFMISPIQAAIDYDGFVQLRVDGKISEFPISYVDPGEEKKLDESKIKIVKSLLGKTESTTVSNLWGTGSLFTRSNLFKGKWQEMRFLTPLLSDFQGMHVSGYACSEWQPLREVTEPKCKGQTAKSKEAKSKTSEQLPADSLMNRINGDVDAMLDCAEQNF